jgi:hypothetical protein
MLVPAIARGVIQRRWWRSTAKGPVVTLGQDHRMSSGKIGWQSFKRRCHKVTESYSSATAKQNCHPTDVGRHVSCGFRQSIPESR